MLKSLADQKKQALILAKISQVMSSSHYSEGSMAVEAESSLKNLYASHTAIALECKLIANAGVGLFAISNYLLRKKGKCRVAIQNNTFFATGYCFSAHDLYLVDSAAYCPSMSLSSLIDLNAKVSLDVVVLTHVAGWVAKDYEGIASYCKSKGIFLVEDCAHAFGVFCYPCASPATLGDASVFSFYPTKALPIGEGGAIVTKDPVLLSELYRFCNYGKAVGSKGFIEYTGGFNFRMSDIMAAVLSVQIECWEDILLARYADYIKLAMLYPCLLLGQSNYYKYPVSKECIVPSELVVGSVYSRTDQLDIALGLHNCCDFEDSLVPLTNSHKWADSHKCLYIGEGVHPRDAGIFMTPSGSLLKI